MNNHSRNNRANSSSLINRERMMEKLRKWFYAFIGLPQDKNEDVAIFGSALPSEFPDFVVEIMDKWVDWIDFKLTKLKEGTNEYADVFGQRGFTLQEFKLVLSGKVPEEDYGKYKVFDYLYLMQKKEWNLFTAITRDDDEEIMERYMKVLMKSIKSEIPILNEFFFARIPLFFPIKSYKRGAHILGASGSGKTELMKVLFYDFQRRSQKHRNKTLVAVEPHGDLAKQLLRFVLNKGKNKERVIYLDPFPRQTAIDLFGEDILGADYIFTINPFDIADRNERVVDYMTQELSSAFFEIITSQETPQMLAIIKACVNSLLRAEGANISHLKRFMDDKENDDLIELGMQNPNIGQRDMIKRMKTDPKLNPTKSGIYYRLQTILGNSTFRRTTSGKSTVDLQKELNSGKVIIFNLSKGKLGSDVSSALGKLMVAFIQSIALRRQDIPEKFRKETFCFIDEFQNFVTPSIETIMAEARKYALHMTLAHQVAGQGMDVKMKRIISGNTAIKIAGHNEPESLEYMSKQMQGITAKDFQKLPPYNFFVSNNHGKVKQAKKLNTPSFLVKESPPYYMSKEELKEVFLYMIHESGYYKKIEKSDEIENLNAPLVFPSGKNIVSEQGEKTNNIYNPKFED